MNAGYLKLLLTGAKVWMLTLIASALNCMCGKRHGLGRWRWSDSGWWEGERGNGLQQGPVGKTM